MDELTKLAFKFGTDKIGHHNYTPIYFSYFKDLKDSHLTILEIGIGGYDHKGAGGASLKMWEAFFTKAKVIGLDIYDKSFLDTDRILTFQVSATDNERINNLFSSLKKPNIIIDDGSHINTDVLSAFEILWPLLEAGGFYFVEDTHTSYWGELATDGKDFKGGNHPNTSMNYFKRLTDSVNYEHCNGRIDMTGIRDDVEFIAFYKELIVIKKT